MKHALRYTSLISIFTIFFISANEAQVADSTMSVIYSMSIEELMNVNITTAGKKAEKISDIPASVVLLTREDIKTAGYTDLAEILENIPGMFLINDYYYTSGTFGLRGFWPGTDDRNMMVLVNGISQVNDFSSTYVVDYITVPVEAIDRIEVVRGPMSVIYGSGAFYGVINIITNEASKSEVSASAGSLKTGKLYGRVAGSLNDFNYVVNASIYNTRGIDQPIGKMVNNPSIILSDSIPLNYKTGGRLENNQKYFSISCTNKPFSFDFSYCESVGEGYFLLPSPFNGSPTLSTSTNAFIDYKKPLTKHVTLEGKFVYSVNRVLNRYDYLFRDFYGIQQNETNAWEGELNTFIKFSKQFDITAGLNSRSILYAYNMFDLPSFGTSTSHQYMSLSPGNSIDVRSIYTQVNYQPFVNLKFVAGIRLEQMPEYVINKLIADSAFSHFPSLEYKYKQDKIAPIPRFAIIWSLDERNILKILYGQAINRPSFFQNTSNNFDPKLPLLQPEWITTYELNYISYLSEKLILNADIFYNGLDNLISRTSELDSSNNYTTWFGNGGKMITTGGEITIQANPFKDLRMEFSGTYQTTKDKRPGFENIQVAYSPKILGYMKVSYGFLKGMTLALTGSYVGKMLPFYDETILNPDSTRGARIGDEVNGYLLLGSNLRIENIFYNGFYLDVKCNNILNNEIRYPTTNNNSWADRGTLGPGRTFLVGIGKKF